MWVVAPLARISVAVFLGSVRGFNVAHSGRLVRAGDFTEPVSVVSPLVLDTVVPEFLPCSHVRNVEQRSPICPTYHFLALAILIARP